MISRRSFLRSSLTTGAGLAAVPQFVATTRLNRDVAGCGDHYSRLFPPGPISNQGDEFEKGLIELAGKMMDNEDAKGESNIFAGYTYLGQFIDHDLTLDITPLDRVKATEVEHTRNFRTPFLDLDHLYGGGPSVSPFLYSRYGFGSQQGAERFLLGKTRESTVVDGTGHTETLEASCRDLPRNAQGIGLAGDSRQDENLILAQLHTAFLRFHNCVVDELELGNIPNPGLEGATIFEQARRLVTWHYQWIVRHDFLRSVLDENVFKQLVHRDYKPLASELRKHFQIPVEFSAAAFRFGHSMVRHLYPYNSWHQEAQLGQDIFQRTGFGKPGNVPVPEEWVIDWYRFFELRSVFFVTNARKIDTRITEDLFHLPSAHIRAFSLASTSKSAFAADPAELPVRTLLRGARMGLRTAQTVARKMLLLDPKIRVLNAGEIANGPQEATIKHYGFDRHSPLWYYILKEAEVINDGNRLGPVGSRIIGEVIVAALAADPQSYVNVVGSEWRPTLWTAAPEDQRPNGMVELLNLATSTASGGSASKACSSTSDFL